MENASKALIIAGAILLSILIIGLGMYIYQQANSATSGTNLDPQKANAYNAEFLQYEGTRSGTDTKALIRNILNHNRVNVDDPTKQIGIVCDYEFTEDQGTIEPQDNQVYIDDYQSYVKSGYTYKITFTYSKGGYITNCCIIKVTNPRRRPPQ